MWQCQPTLRSRSAACLAALTALCIAPPAFADARVWAGPTVANLTTLRAGGLLGVGAQIGGALGITDFLSVTLDFAGSYHFAKPSEDIPADRVVGTGLGLRYDLDVFSFVPYVGVGPTFYVDSPLVTNPPLDVYFGAKVFLGIDWRFHRHWSLGFNAELHAFLTEPGRFPIYNFAGLNAAHHFRF